MIASTPLQEARGALEAHPLRTTIASIGIVVGVATVIASLAVGEGARRAAIADIETLGIDNVFIRATAAQDRRHRPVAPVLRRDDASAVEAAMSWVVAAGAARITRAEVSANGRTAAAPFAGVTSDWLRITRLAAASGRLLAPADAAAARRVAVIGAALAAQLGIGTPGVDVTVNGEAIHLVGILRSRAASASAASLQIFDADASLIVPVDVMDARLGEGDEPDRVTAIAIRSRAGTDASRLAQDASRLLERRHDGGDGGWDAVVPRELLRARLRAQRTFDALLLAVGLLALVLSGAGIMNVMLATVAERTPEIGVRRAFGARRRHIVAQFAVEAALLCLGGGIAGVPLGVGFTGVVARLAGWPVAVSPAGIGLALALAAAVGLAFGIYPAHRAASIDPAAALRAS